MWAKILVGLLDQSRQIEQAFGDTVPCENFTSLNVCDDDDY